MRREAVKSASKDAVKKKMINKETRNPPSTHRSNHHPLQSKTSDMNLSFLSPAKNVSASASVLSSPISVPSSTYILKIFSLTPSTTLP